MIGILTSVATVVAVIFVVVGMAALDNTHKEWEEKRWKS